MSILAVYREPFAFQPHVARLEEGLSLAALRARMPGLPEDFDRVGGMITVNGQMVPTALWGLVKPKPFCAGVPVQVSFHLPIRGGEGEGGGKSGLAAVGAIALLLLSGGAAAGWFATAGGLFTAGSLSANILGLGLSLTAQLLLGALAAPPTKRARDIDRTAGIEANVLEPNGVLPRVLGERRVYPPLATQPVFTLDGDDEIVEAVYALAGPHRLQDIRLGSAAINDVTGVEYEVREGFRGQAPLRFARRYGVTDDAQGELRGHRTNTDDAKLLDDSVDPSLAIPQASVFATRTAPDEFQLHMAFPQGLGKPSSAGTQVRVPLRMRIREAGGSWRNLPEMHIVAAEARILRLVARFVWTDEVAAPTCAATGWAEVRTSSPPQTLVPATEGWEADSYFYAGSGDTYMWGNNVGTTGVQHVYAERSRVTIHLDPAEFPPARYEIEIKRGAAVLNSAYVRAAYTISGAVRDPFAYFGTTPTMPYSRDGLTDTLTMLRGVSLRNSPAVTTDDCALIAVRARNVRLERLSVLAAGYVRDWDGAAWTGPVVSSNPATLLRSLYADSPNLDPAPESILDDTTLLEWRQRCIDETYTCNAYITEGSVFENATLVAGCGYARPYMSDIFGVVQDYDRSAEAPVMVLSQRNSRGLREVRAFPRLPTGLRVTFDDSTDDWKPRQITVWRNGIAGDTSRTEQVRLEGIDTEAAAIAMARYMLTTPELRPASYELEVPPSAALVARGGALVAVTHDSLSEHHGVGRVIAGGTTTIDLDTAVLLVNEPFVEEVADIHAIADVWQLGLRSSAAIQREDHTVDVVALDCVTGTTSTLVFASPQDHVTEDVLVAVGPAEQQSLRLIVRNVTPQEGLTARMVMIDEASELFA